MRGPLSDRETCVQSFAVAYAGALQDFRAEAEEEDGLQFSEICNSLPTDSKKIAYTRKLLNDWNGVPEGTDTSVESSEGGVSEHQRLSTRNKTESSASLYICST